MRKIVLAGIMAVIAMMAIGQNRVGIGTTTPQSLLHLHGGNSNDVRLLFSNNASQGLTGNSMSISFYNNGDPNYNDYGSIYVPNGTGFLISQGLNKPFFINGSGLVGLSNANNPTISLAIGDNGTGIHRPVSYNLAFYTAGIERVRISATGNVGFGITSPLSPVHANSTIIIDRPTTGNTASNASLEFRNGGIYRGSLGWDQAAGRFFFYDGESNSNTLFINNGRVGIQRDPTTNALEVNGNASKATAGDWLANSDARLKKDISPLNNALEKLLQLQGITYEWNDDKTGTTRPPGRHMGFTAQNVQQVFPQLVTTDAQGYLQTSYGTYDALYVEAIKQLLQKITALEAKLQMIEQKMRNDV
jgi:hypothetical protein